MRQAPQPLACQRVDTLCAQAVADLLKSSRRRRKTGSRCRATHILCLDIPLEGDAAEREAPEPGSEEGNAPQSGGPARDGSASAVPQSSASAGEPVEEAPALTREVTLPKFKYPTDLRLLAPGPQHNALERSLVGAQRAPAHVRGSSKLQSVTSQRCSSLEATRTRSCGSWTTVRCDEPPTHGVTWLRPRTAKVNPLPTDQPRAESQVTAEQTPPAKRFRGFVEAAAGPADACTNAARDFASVSTLASRPQTLGAGVETQPFQQST